MAATTLPETKSGLRVLAAASLGGHWVQLLRITSGLAARGCTVHYISTHPKCATMLTAEDDFQCIRDFSRTDAWRILPALWQAIKAVRRVKPHMVISTGAAPGLVAILAGRLTGRRTVWVDSIANAEQLSMCGRIASRLAHTTFTQWPELATKRVRYAGNVLGETEGIRNEE